MPNPFLSPAMPTTPHDLALLKDGWRFCVGDGRLVIGPNEPSWKVRCASCFAADCPATHCQHCGGPIEDHIRNWARDHGGEARSCYLCSRGKLGGRKVLIQKLESSPDMP